MAKQRQKKGNRKPRRGQQRGQKMLFSKRNYQLMVLGVALIVVGFAIMRMENEVDGFISLYVAPLLILGGYLEIIYAILWHGDNEKPVQG